MVVKVPKGFLEKLSKKTREELEKVASEFLHETEETLYPEHQFYGTSPMELLHEPTISYCKTLGKKVKLIKGFYFKEEDTVSSLYRLVHEMEQNNQKYTELKRSVETIKKAITE